MVAGAQIPGLDPLDELTDPVTDVVEETTQTINETTEPVTQVVENGASSTTATTTGIDVAEVNGVASGDGGSNVAGSTTKTDPDPTEGGSARTGGGSGRTRARVVEAGGRHGPRASSAHDLRGRTELEPSYLVSPLVVSKLNDANRNGVHSDSEAAPRAGAAVSFRVVITNAGDVELTITDLRDSFENGFREFGVPVCDGLIGDPLPAKATVSCSFTLEDYAPEEGEKVNTVQVTSVETADSSTRILGGDTSTVLGPDVAVLGKTATNTLATSGRQLTSLLSAMLSLMIAGTLLVGMASLKEKTALPHPSIEGPYATALDRWRAARGRSPSLAS